MGREHKGMLSVTVRSSLNNKHINLMGMASHTSISTCLHEDEEVVIMGQ